MIDLSIPQYLGNEMMKVSDDFFNIDFFESVKQKLMLHVYKEFNPTCYGAFIIGYHLGDWEFYVTLYSDIEIAHKAALRLDDTLRELSKEGQVSVHPEILYEINKLMTVMANCKDIREIGKIWDSGSARILAKFLEIYKLD